MGFAISLLLLLCSCPRLDDDVQKITAQQVFCGATDDFEFARSVAFSMPVSLSP